jgi:hypothetical protein
MTWAKGSLLGFAVLAAAVVVSRCESVPLTAPAGSSIFLQANPTSVPANGGRSLVTALVIEPSGSLVPDGTELLFLTDLGSIDGTAQTVDGIARVYFVSDARSGTATVTAMSGGPTNSPTPSPTPTATSTGFLRDVPAGSGPSTGGFVARAGSAPRIIAATSTSTAAAAQATVKITVGAALPDKVVLGANPQLITSPRYATIVATVYDSNGNPVQNVPVIFRIDSVTIGGVAAPLLERLDSGSAPRYTDSTGQAFDVLSTSAPSSVDPRIVTVSATTSNNKTATVSVAIY